MTPRVVLNFAAAQSVPDGLRGFLPWLDKLVPGVWLRPTPPRDGPMGATRDGYMPRSATVPFHALPLVQGWLSTGNWSLQSIPVDRRRLDEWSEEELRHRAECMIDTLKLHEWLRSPEGEPRMSYQWNALGYATLREQDALALHWAPGSGKTRAAIEWALTRVALTGPGAQLDIVILCPSSVVRHWERQIRKWTTCDPFVWVAPSRRRKKDPDGLSYVQLGRLHGEPSIVIVGHENVVDFWEEKKGIRSHLIAGSVVVFDEAHLFRGIKRKRMVPSADGRKTFSERKTNSGDRLQSNVLREIAEWAGPRIELTATPIGNRLDQLWVQLDLLDPGAWGSYYTWSARHCGGVAMNERGWQTGGAQNIEEHRLRVRHFFYEVPMSVSHAALPPKRRETIYLPVSEQVNELGGWVKSIAKSRAEGRGRELEIKLMQAASRKRRYVLRRALETVQAGGKVVLLTGRRKDVEALHEGLTKSGTEGVWWASGERSQEERAECCAQYMAWQPSEHEGRGAVLVGTLDCLGIGIDLQDTDLLLMAMIPWTWDVLWQAENRCSRLGQVRPVLVEFVIAEGTIDEHVAQTFLSKLPAIGAATPDLEVAKVGESLRGMDDVEGLLDRIFAKVTGEPVYEKEAP